MNHRPLHIVLTTIFAPDVLYDYYKNFSHFDHLDDIKIWIIGDRKTPARAGDIAQDLTRKGLETVYLDIDAQDQWGARCLKFYQRLPFDNETRRNIGYLCALEDGCETLIAIDDDTYPGCDDFAGSHKKTGQPWPFSLLHEPSGFHNICEYLEIQPEKPVYPRGFPFLSRNGSNHPEAVAPSGNIRIGVNTGLWTGAPDLDAVTWLNGQVESRAYTGDHTYLLAHDTWTPVNSQNVSITRELIPACLCVPMGWDMPGGKIQRYGDIWGGYFLQAIIGDSPYHIAFGTPIVEHRRHPHHLLDDLRYEYWGMMLTDWLIGLLRSDFTPRQSTIIDRVEELGSFIEDSAVSAMPEWCPDKVRNFMRWTAGNISTWRQACRQFL